MKSYIVTCTYTSDGGGTAQQYMVGEDYEEGTTEYENELFANDGVIKPLDGSKKRKLIKVKKEVINSKEFPSQ